MISLKSSNRNISSLAATLALFSCMPLASHAQDFQGASSLHGKTVIMASHDPKAVEKFRKVYNMRDGQFEH